MTKTSYIIIGVVAIIGIMLLYWYISVQSTEIEIIPEETPTPSDMTDETPAAQLPNPASVYCEDEMGGELQIVETADGQVGVCRLPDDRWCDEQELYLTGTCVFPEGVTDAMLYGKG